MASSQDIRTWAAENGIALKPKGPPTKRATEAYYAAHGQVDTIADVADVADVDPDLTEWPDEQPPAPETPPHPEPPSTAGEKPPTQGRRRWRERLRLTAKRPLGRGRASTEKIIDIAWSQLARLFDGETSWATANVLRMQAPVAGAILDAEIRGTAADALLQPVARMVNRGSNVGALIALPVLVQVVSARPELYPKLEPLMVDAVYSYLEVAGPAVERKRKQHQRRAEQYGQDAQEFLRAVFTPPARFAEQTPDDAAAA